MSAFVALIVDAYRELNSRRLFWITLSLSVLNVVAYGSIGFDETGMSLFYGIWHVDNEIIVAGSPYAHLLYRSIFSTFMLSLWLGWIATILALISTTTIFPDFLASGAIELVLARPIGRIRLFFAKYATSLLFVLLQVSLFCTGVFLCMGARLGDWEWKIFAAIPVVLAFYSYLFCVNVLVGTWTRSALTALLLTLLFWFSLFGINQSEAMINMFKTQGTIQIERADREIERLVQSRDAVAGSDAPDALTIARIDAELDNQRTAREAQVETIGTLDRWQRGVRAIQTVLPKTSETMALLDRWLKRPGDVNLMDLFQGNVIPDGQGGFTLLEDRRQDAEVQRRLEAEYGSRSEWYVAGTSLLFEAVVLCIACAIFVRRDF